MKEYVNKRPHRYEGHSIERSDGIKGWFLNDKLHRGDGPAYEGSDGSKSWYLNGVEYLFSEWIKMVDISREEKCELVLNYG